MVVKKSLHLKCLLTFYYKNKSIEEANKISVHFWSTSAYFVNGNTYLMSDLTDN